MKKYLFVVWCFVCFSATAQSVVVPNNVYFADLHLKITEKGRQEIQKKVDALHKYPNYFKIKVDRADTYFPIIERVFQQEGLPDDFKFLALQESGLIGDAVSTSNAVGYWQFKKEAASDQGLRMNSYVDERKHIIESSRGAARYLIRNNAHYRNWANTLLSYMEGFTGAKPYTKPSDVGASSMEITEKTHYYVLTFLAHKIAFENFVGKKDLPLVSLQEVEAKPGQSLSDIALSTQIDPLELERYNKWLVGSAVPGDKKYTVLIPVMNEEQEELLVSAQQETTAKGPVPSAKGRKAVARTKMIRVNDLKAVIAGKGETKEKMARRGNMRVGKFLRLNEMRASDPIQEGETYFLEAKRNRASVAHHVAQPGETMASVSRKYGVREKALLTKNRMHADEQLAPGRVVWLQATRPRSLPVEYRNQKEETGGTGAVAQNTPAPADTALPAAPAEKAPAKRGRIDWRGEREANEAPAKAPRKGGSSSEYVTADEENPEFFPTEWSISASRDAAKGRSTATRKPAATAAPTARPGTKPAPTRTAPAKAGPVASPSPSSPAVAEPATAPEEAVPAATEAESEADPALAAPAEEPVLPKRSATPAQKGGVTAAPAPREETRREVTEAEETAPEPVRTAPARKEPVRVAQPKEKAETPAPAPEARPAVTAAPETRPGNSGSHTVARGETLYAIARQYGVSVAELKEWNKMGEKPIAVGQELTVAAPAAKEVIAEKAVSTAPNSPRIHTVATGETIYQISRKYGVTIKEVMEWNKKSDFTVKVGEELTIKAKN